MKLRKLNPIQLSVIILCLLILAFLAFELLFKNKVYRHAKASSSYQKEDYSTAEKIWEKARGGSKDPIPENSLGKAQYRLGKYQESSKSQAEAIKKNKESSRYHFDRGNALYRQDDMDAALEAYREAMLLDPDDHDAKSNYELVLYRQKYEPPEASNGKQDKPQKTPEPEKSPPDNTDEQNKYSNQLDALDQQEARDRQNQSSNKRFKDGGKWW
ncbi:MAG: tetratricopeptide repeat protein [Candidatus Cloacimonadaceae bacterium]|jgi:tetratricopeptide (TPR) repeat protein|nr:tetratricopeptide repeat protein [Candidatus Cloacimonadota bacterium]MDX9948887.1 tetratricopeptide repeat protein [Candidatus Syntrophosphaera sp.]